MSKRYRSNYSLWPEQARPRRTIPVTLAVGGFAVGIVCAVAAHNVVTDFLRPTTVTEEAPYDSASTSASTHVPVYATAAAPAAAPEAVEPASRTRLRSPAAKMTLPSIGTRAAAPSAVTDGAATDGLGGDTLAGETPFALAAAPPAAPSKAIEESPSKPAEQSSAEPSEQPKAKAERSNKPAVRRTVKKRRQQPSNYATRRNVPFFGFGGPGYYGGYGGQVYARQQYYY